MTVPIDLGGDPSFDLVPQGQSNLHGRVEWKPSTNEYRVVKADGTAVAVTGTRTRPTNRALSNIGLNDPESPSYGQPQCQWDNAAWEPAISRTAPASFTGNAVASWRLFDDSDRCWWIVVEAVSDQLVVWLHRPATIFLQAMQPFPAEGRELHRFYLPDHLVGERVHVAFTPRGNKAILQVITDKSDLPLDTLPNSAPERYTVPWAQFVRVIDFTGTGSWPEQVSDPAWGVGIESVASLYVSAYSTGANSLSVVRTAYGYAWANDVYVDGPWLMQDGEQVGEGGPSKNTDDYPLYYAALMRYGGPPELAEWTDSYYGNLMLAYQRDEQLSVPLLVFFDESGAVNEHGWQLSYTDAITPAVAGSDYRDHWVEGDTSNLVSAPVRQFPTYTERTETGYYWSASATRSAAMNVALKKNGVTELTVSFSASNQACDAVFSPDLGLAVTRTSGIYHPDVLRFVVHADVSSVAVVPVWSSLRGLRFLDNAAAEPKEYGYQSDSFKQVFWSGLTGSGQMDVSGNHRLAYGYESPYRWFALSGDPRITSLCDLAGRFFKQVPDDVVVSAYASSNIRYYLDRDLAVGCLSKSGSDVPYLVYRSMLDGFNYDGWIHLGYC